MSVWAPYHNYAALLPVVGFSQHACDCTKEVWREDRAVLEERRNTVIPQTSRVVVAGSGIARPDLIGDIHPPDGPSFVHEFHGDDTPSKWRTGSEADLLLEERNHGRLGGNRVRTFEVVNRPSMPESAYWNCH